MSGWSAATYLAAAAVAVSAGSAVYSGQQQKKAADTQAQIAENNAAYSADSARAHAEKVRKAGRAQQGDPGHVRAVAARFRPGGANEFRSYGSRFHGGVDREKLRPDEETLTCPRTRVKLNCVASGARTSISEWMTS